jgi:hypothetical protein
MSNLGCNNSHLSASNKLLSSCPYLHCKGEDKPKKSNIAKQITSQQNLNQSDIFSLRILAASIALKPHSLLACLAPVVATTSPPISLA